MAAKKAAAVAEPPQVEAVGPTVELDGQLYKISDLSDDAKQLVQFVTEANELMKLKEVEFRHIQFGRETALNQLRDLTKDLESTPKE